MSAKILKPILKTASNLQPSTVLSALNVSSSDEDIYQEKEGLLKENIIQYVFIFIHGFTFYINQKEKQLHIQGTAFLTFQEALPC